MDNLKDLSKYSQVDVEKSRLIDQALLKCSQEKLMLNSIDMNYKMEDVVYEDACLKKAPIEPFTKYCPECGREYPKKENVCFDCLVHLKDITDKVNVRDVEINPQFTFKGNNDIEDVLSEENIFKITEFRFSMADLDKIIRSIKLQAFKNFDNAIKDNDIDYDILEILDKIILFTKSFVNVEFKSYGGLLGYFESNTIYVDDRQTKSLQITTLLHELSHFLIKEILIGVVCTVLDTSKNQNIDDFVEFILSAMPFAQLIDEYSAHNVEGRFTLFGYQDYSSFRQIESTLEGTMDSSEIEVTKTIGNTFALKIKDIIESLVDGGLREEIKTQFMSDVLDRPNYAALKMENCNVLNDEGFIKAIWLILTEGIKADMGK